MDADRDTPSPPFEPEWRDEDADSLPRATTPASGLLALVGIVLIGLLPATYYMFARPLMHAQRDAEVAAANESTEARIAEWFSFGQAMIHHRITRWGRFSEQHPWVVTHAVEEGGARIAYGVDAEALTPELSRVDGLTVVVDVPAATRLGPIELVGERARSVPIVETPPDEAELRDRLATLLLWFLEGLPAALEEDIEGASIELRIGGAVVVPRLADRPVAQPPGAAADPAPGPVDDPQSPGTDDR